MNKSTFEKIDEIVESVVGKEDKLYKKFCLYASHQMVGFPLKEIGTYYNMRGSAISQSCRRFKQHLTKDKKLRQIESAIKQGIRMSNVET